MVLLDCSAGNQQTILWRTQENGRQHKSGFQKNPDCPWKIWNFSDQAYTLLALLCKDEAWAHVRSAENGYQAWQALLRARAARNATNLLNQLLEPTFTSPDPRINIRQWNKNAEEYATRTGERTSDGIRRAVYMNKIAPQDMRQHLMLNQSRLSTAEEVAQEIGDYCDATEEFSRDDKNQAGFIAPVGKGPVKGGKPNGVPYNFGKGSGTKGKGKMHKGLGSQPECGEQRKCQTRQRKGKVTASPRAKAKVMARARKNIQEKEPQPGPGWISEWRWTAHVGWFWFKTSKSWICWWCPREWWFWESPIGSSSLRVLRSKVQ